MSSLDHRYRINEIMSYIHRHLSEDLGAKTLAKRAAYSEQHFHRVFKAMTGEAVHSYIRRTRLEAAANQLLFSPSLPVEKIALACGFQSLSSFGRAFKSVYGLSPGQWRIQSETPDAYDFLNDREISEAYYRSIDKPLPKPEIVMLPSRELAYVRHKGYGRSIAEAWEILRAWALEQDRAMDYQVGVHHSNPARVALAQCHYVACIAIDQPIARRGRINSVTLPGGLHAGFRLSGQYGDLIPYILSIYERWLPESPFGVKTTPAFAHYHKNQFLLGTDEFDLTFYLPIVLQK